MSEKKWEYRIETYEGRDIDFLNELGLEGWELCCVWSSQANGWNMTKFYFFKRRLSQ